MKTDPISTTDGTRVRYIVCPIEPCRTDDKLFFEPFPRGWEEPAQEEWTYTVLLSTN